MDKANYTVKSRLDHDNRLYLPDSVVALDVEDAEPLLAAGVIEPAPEEAVPSKGKKK